jgi:superfamily I DNA/RNA helicase
MGTMHRAKGLEFKAVAVVGCDLDLLPLKSVIDTISDPVDRAAFQEQERNLLYVAFTRARENLFVSCCGEPSVLIRESQR